jgi:predicted phage terminase large subunit-like protein
LVGYTVVTSPETGDKVTRAEPVAAQVNVGNVSMLRGDWNLAFINELRAFPNGANDDQVDGLSRAFAELIVQRVATVTPLRM